MTLKDWLDYATTGKTVKSTTKRPRAKGPIKQKTPFKQWVKVTVTKPFCAPARDIILTSLHSYGVAVRGGGTEIKEMLRPVDPRHLSGILNVELRRFENLGLPSLVCWYATFYVQDNQLDWAHELLERTMRVSVAGVDPVIRQRAIQHNGRMPKPWDPTMATQSANMRGFLSNTHSRDEFKQRLIKAGMAEPSCPAGMKAWENLVKEVEKAR